MTGTASRRPDVYFDSTVHCYLERVLTKANAVYARKDVEKHILRFFPVVIRLHTMKSKTPILQFCTIKIVELTYGVGGRSLCAVLQ